MTRSRLSESFQTEWERKDLGKVRRSVLIKEGGEPPEE